MVARVHDRVSSEGRTNLLHTLDAASPRWQPVEFPHVPGTRLAWLEAGAAVATRALIAAARSGRAGRPRHGRRGARRARRVLAVSRAPQHVERDLLLIEAEGLAPIGLVLVLVGVRLFERAGRRHRKQLETIALAAQRMGDGDATSRWSPAAARSAASPDRSSTSRHGLRDLDRERGLYVSQVSHDLRNPLAVIGAYASVLRRGERSRPRAAKLQTIEDEVSRLAVMVDDLLALGRTHALSLHIQRAPADVRASSHDAVAAARARSGRIRVLLLAPAAPMTAVVDAQRLRQALDNLLDNALRHAGSEVRVELVQQSPDELVLSVEDDGPGIDRLLLPHLFDAFAHGGDRAAAPASASRPYEPSPRRTAAA